MRSRPHAHAPPVIWSSPKNSDRGHGAGVLDAGVSASINKKQEVLTDQQHKRRDTRE